jgi:putative ATPase
LLLSDRDAIMGLAEPGPGGRFLVLKADDGALVWEALRRVPDGLVAACVSTDAARQTLLRLAGSAGLDEAELPKIAVFDGASLAPPVETAEEFFGCAVFDRIVVREPWRRASAASVGTEAARAARLLSPDGLIVFIASPPALGERLSRVIGEATGPLQADAALIQSLKMAEDEFLSAKADENGEETVFWDAETLKAGFAGAGFELSVSVLEQKEERLIAERDISAWFNSERSSWGGAIRACMGEADFEAVKELLRVRARQGPVTWRWKSLLCRAER